MVLVTHDWERFKEYAEHCRVGSYSKHEVMDGVEIRVMCGRFGYIGVYNKENTGLAKAIRFCNLQGFIEVEESISDEMFHA